MAIPSAARVDDKYTGEATVIDNSAFYSTMYSIQKDIIAERNKKKEELKKQNAKWNDMLGKMPDVYQADSEHVTKALNEYNDYIISLKSQGIDPTDMDPTVMRKIRELENNVAKMAYLSKDNEAYSDNLYKTVNGDKDAKYNKEHAADWMKRYADPKLTPEERYKMRTEENPLKINYSMVDFIDDTIPKEGVTDTGKKKVTSRDPEQHKAFVLDYIMNDPAGQEKYEALKKMGEDEAAFAERVAQQGQSRYPVKEDLQVGSTRKSSSSSSTVGTKTKKPSIKVSTKDTDPKYDQGIGINKILYENTKPVYVKDVNGKTVDNFDPSGGFKISPDGNVYAIGTGKDDQGVQIDVTVNYGQNKEQFDVAGYTDVFQDFYDKNNQKASGTTGGATSGGGSLADQMRANAGVSTGQKKKVTSTPTAQAGNTAATTSQAAAPAAQTSSTTASTGTTKGGWKDEWTLKMLEHEQAYGAPGGNKFDPKGKYAFENWTGKNAKRMEDEYINPVRSQVPDFDSLPDQTKVRLVDYRFNTGRSTKDLILLAAGLIDIDQINADEKTRPGVGKELKDAWAKFDQSQLKDPNFAKKIDAAKKEVYKTTKSASPDLDPDNLSKNWLVRTDMWNDFSF